MAVSISDVAQRAGVSQGTVSHVMNGNARAGIAIATQERVRKAAMELGYQPNRMARMLGRGRTDTLGLFISQLHNPFFIQIMEAAERLALESGYHVLIDAAPTDRDLAHHKARLRGWPMDGVLMHAEPHQSIATYLGAQAENLPVVYMGGQPRQDLSDTVFFDVHDGARTAMQYLIERGYRKIAYVFPYQWIIDKAREPRYRAYLEVCGEVGIEPRLIRMEKQEESRHAGLLAGMTIAEIPVTDRPDALLCFNDVVAEGVLFGLRRKGLRVPEDMAIVGFDGREDSQALDVPLTTVRMDVEELCREALQALLRRIKEGQSASPQIVKISTRLLIGGTA